MALVDGEQAFAEALTVAMMKPTGSVGESAQNMAEAFSTLFAYATLDGVNINPGSNTSAAALEALQLGLEESFSVEEDAEASAELMEDALLTYLNEAPISDMWSAALSAEKAGPDLYTVMTEAMEGFEDNAYGSKVQVARGIVQWVNESVSVDLDEDPPRAEFVI